MPARLEDCIASIVSKRGKAYQMKTQLTLTLGAVILICGLGFAEPAAAVTLTVGTNINLTKLVNNQTETTIAVNPLNPQNLFAAANGSFSASVNAVV